MIVPVVIPLIDYINKFYKRCHLKGLYYYESSPVKITILKSNLIKYVYYISQEIFIGSKNSLLHQRT